MGVWCGAWSDMSDKSDLSDIIGAPPTRARWLVVDKFVFAIMSGPQTETTHSPEPQPRGMATIEPVGSLRALNLLKSHYFTE